MNHQAIKQIAKQLREVATSTSPVGEQSSNFQMHDGVAYSLTNEASILLNEIIGKIHKQKDFIQKFSSKYIDKKIKSVFAKLLSEDGLDLESALSTLIIELTDFRQDCVVFLKVDGLLLSLCFKLGRVRFVPGDKYLIEDLKNKSSAIIGTLRDNGARAGARGSGPELRILDNHTLLSLQSAPFTFPRLIGFS